jgi:O-methyltransferase
MDDASARQGGMGSASVTGRYLDLMKHVLTRTGFDDSHLREVQPPDPWRSVLEPALGALHGDGYRLVQEEPTLRAEGRDWPSTAETMIGMRRIDNLQHCIESVLADDVPGDLLEAGVWRGGAAIFMRAVLAAHDITSRTVWVADSFEGLPAPDPARFPADEGLDFHTYEQLAVDVETVKQNFAKYGLLDPQVRFLVGWFSDTLPTAEIDELAVLRLDGDLYESTWSAITALEPKVAVGGYVIVDDYGCVPACARAVDDYRAEKGIAEAVEEIDWTGVFWRKLERR